MGLERLGLVHYQDKRLKAIDKSITVNDKQERTLAR